VLEGIASPLRSRQALRSARTLPQAANDAYLLRNAVETDGRPENVGAKVSYMRL
jgi:hypothetical protein